MPALCQRIRLRDERPEDESFLRELHDTARREELEIGGLPKSLWPGFLEMQFRAQQQGYRSAFPGAQFSVVLLSGRPVGRLVIDRPPDAVQLIDIALMPDVRGKGIGTELVKQLKREASTRAVPLRLQVIRGQRAARLYQRLGFVKTGENEIRDLMEWRASTQSNHAIQPETSPAV